MCRQIFGLCLRLSSFLYLNDPQVHVKGLNTDLKKDKWKHPSENGQVQGMDRKTEGENVQKTTLEDHEKVRRTIGQDHLKK